MIRARRIVLLVAFLSTFLVFRLHSSGIEYREPKPLLDIDLTKILSNPNANIKTNATFYSIIKSSQASEMLMTVQSVEARFNHKYHYDWVFVSHRPINQVSRRLLANSVSGTSIFYQIPKIQWGFPLGVRRDLAAKLRRRSKLNGITTGISDYFRFRSRYQAGFQDPNSPLTNYKYYMRVEPGTLQTCDYDADWFVEMETNGYKFGVVSTLQETVKLYETLSSKVAAFIEEHLLKNYMQLDDCFFSNSMEIVDLDFIRSEQYQEFFQYIDQFQGWFYERWTDYHIHTVLSLLYLSPDELKFFNICHKVDNSNYCSAQEQFYLQNHCFCNPMESNYDLNCLEKLSTLIPNDLELKSVISFEKMDKQRLRKDFENDKLYEKEIVEPVEEEEE